MSKFKTMPGDLEIVRGGTLLEKYNPNHGADGRFTSGGGGSGAPIKEGDLLLKHFEKKVDKVLKHMIGDSFQCLGSFSTKPPTDL